MEFFIRRLFSPMAIQIKNGKVKRTDGFDIYFLSNHIPIDSSRPPMHKSEENFVWTPLLERYESFAFKRVEQFSLHHYFASLISVMGQSVSSILPTFIVNFFSTMSSVLTTGIANLATALFGESDELKTNRFFTHVLTGDFEELSALIDSLSDDELESLLHMQYPPEVDNGRTALVLAASDGHAEVVALLLEKGANTQETSRVTIGLTTMNALPLWFAVVHGHLEVCRHLITHGANVNGGTDSGETPLLRACYRNQLDIVVLLVESGADIEFVDVDGYTALMTASICGEVDTVRYLLSNGARTDHTDNTGAAFALMCAVERGHLEVCRLLLAADADVNQASSDGCTSLMYASFLGLSDIVIFLIENDANIELTDADGTTALMLASKGRRVDIVQYLLVIGARADRKNNQGKTARDLAIENGNADIVDILYAFAEQMNPNAHNEPS